MLGLTALAYTQNFVFLLVPKLIFIYECDDNGDFGDGDDYDGLQDGDDYGYDGDGDVWP